MDPNYHSGQYQQHHTEMDQLLSARAFVPDNFNFGDVSAPPNTDQALLSGIEQNAMNNFFTNPDDFNGEDMMIPFGYVPVSAHQQDHSSTFPPGTSSLHPTHVDAAAWLRVTNNTHVPDQSTLDGDDINAANVMESFRYDDNHSGPSSWGALTNHINSVGDITGMTSSNGGMVHGLHMPNANAFHGHQNSGQGHLNGSNIHSQADSTRQPWTNINMTPDQLLSANHRARDQSYTNSAAYAPSFSSQWRAASSTTPTSSHAQGRINGPMFGSDPTFTSGRFISSQATNCQDEKSGNLLNVPLAEAAATSGVRQHPPNGIPGYPVMKTHNSTGGLSGYQNQQQNGSAWPTMSMQPAGNAERPRKRARSQSQHHDDDVKQEPDSDDDVADADRGSSKRRKSNQFARGQTSNSPLGGDDDAAAKRRNSRKKENLSDQQKRFNHIQSEKKRRELINKGYYDLNNLVPSLAVGKSGLSRSECLAEVNLYLNTLKQGTALLLERLKLPLNALDGIKATPAPSGPAGL